MSSWFIMQTSISWYTTPDYDGWWKKTCKCTPRACFISVLPHQASDVHFSAQEADSPAFPALTSSDLFGCLQNANGPCPLLAIANIMSLRNQLQIEANTTSLSEKRLLSLVAGRILDTYQVRSPLALLNSQQLCAECPPHSRCAPE